MHSTKLVQYIFFSELCQRFELENEAPRGLAGIACIRGGQSTTALSIYSRINLAPARSCGISEFLIASSKFSLATRACSRVRTSARIPSRFSMASTIQQCWCAETRKRSRSSLETCCLFRNALGDANGSEHACRIARRSMRLWDRSTRAAWNFALRSI